MQDLSLKVNLVRFSKCRTRRGQSYTTRTITYRLSFAASSENTNSVPTFSVLITVMF